MFYCYKHFNQKTFIFTYQISKKINAAINFSPKKRKTCVITNTYLLRYKIILVFTRWDPEYIAKLWEKLIQFGRSPHVRSVCPYFFFIHSPTLKPTTYTHTHSPSIQTCTWSSNNRKYINLLSDFSTVYKYYRTSQTRETHPSCVRISWLYSSFRFLTPSVISDVRVDRAEHLVSTYKLVPPKILAQDNFIPLLGCFCKLYVLSLFRF